MVTEGGSSAQGNVRWWNLGVANGGEKRVGASGVGSEPRDCGGF